MASWPGLRLGDIFKWTLLQFIILTNSLIYSYCFLTILFSVVCLQFLYHHTLRQRSSSGRDDCLLSGRARVRLFAELVIISNCCLKLPVTPWLQLQTIWNVLHKWQIDFLSIANDQLVVDQIVVMFALTFNSFSHVTIESYKLHNGHKPLALWSGLRSLCIIGTALFNICKINVKCNWCSTDAMFSSIRTWLRSDDIYFGHLFSFISSACSSAAFYGSWILQLRKQQTILQKLK